MRFPLLHRPIGLGRRCLSDESASRVAKGSADDIFESIKVNIEKKSGIRDWLRDIQTKMEAQSAGPFFLGGDRPFAHNPAFQPRPPITNALRNRLYQLHLSDPTQWTPRRLSAQFKVAIPRIKAVIKMKELEDKMLASGKLQPNEEYVGKMEEHLGARAPVQVEVEETTKGNSIAEHLRPMFVAMPETAPPLSYEDASRLLGRKPITQSTEGTKVEAETSTETSTNGSPHGQFIRFDPYEKARSRFLFVDTTPGVRPRARSLLVRESNGDLRTGTNAERLRVARRVWGRAARHFMK